MGQFIHEWSCSIHAISTFCSQYFFVVHSSFPFSLHFFFCIKMVPQYDFFFRCQKNKFRLSKYFHTSENKNKITFIYESHGAERAITNAKFSIKAAKYSIFKKITRMPDGIWSNVKKKFLLTQHYCIAFHFPFFFSALILNNKTKNLLE